MPDQGQIQGAPDQGPATEFPVGPVQGKANLLPQFGNLGQIRPFGPGEYLDMGDKGWASEMTYTLPYNGQWSVLPGLWVVNGVPTRVTEDQATQYAQQSGLVWPSFENEELANQYANQREATWQKTPMGRSDMQPSLWSRKWPPPR